MTAGQSRAISRAASAVVVVAQRARSTQQDHFTLRVLIMAYNEDSSASGHDEPWIQW